jgi:beta-phosphoglucomutase-like phosphatase (HAD superfamily)
MSAPTTQFRAHALLFDLDGTVIDNSEAHYQAWRKLGAQFGKTISRDDYTERYLGKNTREVIRTVWNEQPDDSALQSLYSQKLTIYSELLAEYGRVVDGFTELHAWAQAHNLPVGLVTNSTPQSRQATLGAFGLTDAFECVVGADHGLPLKPDPAMYRHAAALLGVQAQDCVIFEDCPVGLEAGRKADMNVVGITTTHEPVALANAHFTIHHYGQLHFAVDKNGRHIIGKK